MYQIESLGQTSSIPPPCEPYTGSRITFRSEGLTLTVPSLPEDANIRWMMERGEGIVNAYKWAGAASIVPDAAIRACVAEVFRTPYYDYVTDEWKTGPGQFTCVQMHQCFANYIQSRRAFPEETPKSAEDRRFMIADGVFAPSANECRCIRDRFRRTNNLSQAYTECAAADILPAWPGAVEFIANAVNQSPGSTLYEIIRTASTLYTVTQPKPVPPLSPPVSPPPAEEKKSSILVYLAIAALAYLYLSQV